MPLGHNQINCIRMNPEVGGKCIEHMDPGKLTTEVLSSTLTDFTGGLKVIASVTPGDI